MRVDEFNALPADDARALVAGWLGVRRWVDEVVAGRPYCDTDALRRQAHDSALDQGVVLGRGGERLELDRRRRRRGEG